MLFEHRKTNRDALWITAYNETWTDQDDPNLYRIREFHDLPDMPYSDWFTIPPEIWELQGKNGLWHYFKAFLDEHPDIDGKRGRDDFWLLVMPSGFPDKILPESEAK